MLTPLRRRPQPPRDGSRFDFSPYPTGWFAVAASDELATGEIKALRYFGRDLVAFRDAEGVARVLDAHCPHLGAHLARGGCVEGGTVRCPYHGWRFDGDGQCVDIPYTRKIPAHARVGAWTTREVNDQVFVWHDEAGGDPTFELPVVDACASAAWVRQPGKTWIIRGHIQDFAENGVDAAHFLCVHGFDELPHMLPETHGAVMQVRSRIKYPEAMGGVEGTLLTTNAGLGFNLTCFSGLVETQLVFTATPIDAGTSVLRVTPYLRDLGDAEVMATVGSFFVAEVATQIEADIPIWEHKVTVARPVLCEGDGPVGVFRRWVRQFYPGNLAGAALPGSELLSVEAATGTTGVAQGAE